ncbi:MAG: hypothetical protein GY869_23565, partial [Planctomycetes bacterium]|nr:hypothetical protein [Planctomycetota bacterium]
KISDIIDRNGNYMSLAYGVLGQMSFIHDTQDTAGHNRDIVIAYNANGLIESITDFTGRSVRYEYYQDGDPGGSAGDLKSVTSPAVTGTPNGNDFSNGKTTVYTYTTGFADEQLNHNLLTITDPKGQTVLQNTYATNPDDPNYDHVVRLVLGEPDDIIDYHYRLQEPNAANNYAITRTIVNDRAGHVTEHLYDNHNRLLSAREYTGRADPNLPTSLNPDMNIPVNRLRNDDPPFFETRYEYNVDSLPVLILFTDGMQDCCYDEQNTSRRSQGNLLCRTWLPGPLGGDQSQIVHQFEYDPVVNHDTNRLTRYVDPRGNETLHLYDTSGNRIDTTQIIPGSDPNIINYWEYNSFGQVIEHILPDIRYSKTSSG